MTSGAGDSRCLGRRKTRYWTGLSCKLAIAISLDRCICIRKWNYKEERESSSSSGAFIESCEALLVLTDPIISRIRRRALICTLITAELIAQVSHPSFSSGKFMRDSFSSFASFSICPSFYSDILHQRIVTFRHRGCL